MPETRTLDRGLWRSLLLGSLAVMLPWGGLAGQEDLLVTFGDRQGWLGLEIRFESDGSQNTPGVGGNVLVIAGVASGSPADQAGVEAGDVVLRIDGAPASRQELRRLERELVPGTPVTLSLDRGGEPLSLVLEAAEPPQELRRETVTVLHRGPGATDWSQSFRIDLDSLRDEIEALNLDRLADVRLRVDSVRTLLEEERLEDVLERLDLDERNLEVLRRFEQFDPTQDPIWVPGVPVPPILLGSRMIGGAELTELNPSLGRYFGIEEGVLVTEVTPRSPAAESGIEAGDVIVEIDGQEVASMREIRDVLGSSSVVRGDVTIGSPRAVRDVLLTVIREGERVSLVLLR